MSVTDRLDAARTQWNVLGHPFYLRWSAGELEGSELACYAGEYRHAVVALADAAQAAAEAAHSDLGVDLHEHAAEERDHVRLWDEFASALGAERDRPARPESAECASAWRAGDDALERLAVLYAVEASQPPIAQTKLDGLCAHYGRRPDEPATAYFAVHAQRDHDHAASSRELLLERAAEADADRLVARGEAALAANWRLLDGVEAASGR